MFSNVEYLIKKYLSSVSGVSPEEEREIQLEGFFMFIYHANRREPSELIRHKRSLRVSFWCEKLHLRDFGFMGGEGGDDVAV